ncbi:hypothetical protein EDD18DRAFT_1107783 [Armillaria luteobubalina]|uniref:Uncharacterized protein n=1 Tax=Armillaria luteobubalina TaxID=153913 RepID=A0AA39Q062_9AGAR|nr:hypothetical protein EDD18DRAFT_1107783 [Armillaria luteobubalina]
MASTCHQILQQFPNPPNGPLPPLPLCMPTLFHNAPIKMANIAKRPPRQLPPKHLHAGGVPSFPPPLHIGSQDQQWHLDFTQPGPPSPITTSKMLKALSTEKTPPTHICLYFTNLLHNNMNHTLHHMDITKQDQLKLISSTTTVADMYLVMAGLGTGLSFLFALSANICEWEAKKLKKIEGFRVVVLENLEGSLALLDSSNIIISGSGFVTMVCETKYILEIGDTALVSTGTVVPMCFKGPNMETMCTMHIASGDNSPHIPRNPNT